MTKLRNTLLASMVLLLVACAAPGPTHFVDKSLFPQLKVSETSKAETRSLLGDPSYTDTNSDGRSIFMYDISKNEVLSLLYSPEGILVKIDVFQR